MIPDVRILHVRASGRSPLLAFKPYVSNQRNKNKASTDSTFVLKSADFQQTSAIRRNLFVSLQIWQRF